MVNILKKFFYKIKVAKIIDSILNPLRGFLYKFFEVFSAFYDFLVEKKAFSFFENLIKIYFIHLIFEFMLTIMFSSLYLFANTGANNITRFIAIPLLNCISFFLIVAAVDIVILTLIIRNKIATKAITKDTIVDADILNSILDDAVLCGFLLYLVSALLTGFFPGIVFGNSEHVNILVDNISVRVKLSLIITGLGALWAVLCAFRKRRINWNSVFFIETTDKNNSEKRIDRLKYTILSFSWQYIIIAIITLCTIILLHRCREIADTSKIVYYYQWAIVFITILGTYVVLISKFEFSGNLLLFKVSESSD